MLRPDLRAALCALVLIATSAEAVAQEYLAMSSRQNRLVAPEQQPHVSVPKRPDFYVRPALLICDTRDPAARARELEASMRALLAAAAADPGVETAILRRSGEDAFAIPLEDFDLFQNFVTPGPRPDSSQVAFLVKTPVAADDDLESVEDRLEAFRGGVAMDGRTELLLQGPPELSLVDPRQYRLEVIQAI
ncbi:MAG: hypothetical protein AAFW46_18165, partial [Pseudomonadota bacterium]